MKCQDWEKAKCLHGKTYLVVASSSLVSVWRELITWPLPCTCTEGVILEMLTPCLRWFVLVIAHDASFVLSLRLYLVDPVGMEGRWCWKMMIFLLLVTMVSVIVLDEDYQVGPVSMQGGILPQRRNLHCRHHSSRFSNHCSHRWNVWSGEHQPVCSCSEGFKGARCQLKHVQTTIPSKPTMNIIIILLN